MMPLPFYAVVIKSVKNYTADHEHDPHSSRHAL